MSEDAIKPILIVEDNADDELLMIRALRKNNIINEIVVARDGQEALDYLTGSGSYSGRDLSLMPQIVLLDLKLPKLSGIDVLKRIRSDNRTHLTPVIILTTSREEDDLVKCYQNGANSYLRKPVDFNAFIDVVRHIGIYWLILNEPPPENRNI